jgi:hypothetical protein
MVMRTIYLVSILFGTACATESNSDPSVYLTGTEESYVTNAQTGAKECLGHKQLICHIPPGNPGNAHTICVGKPAVDPHVAHHGDGIGACATEPTDPPSDPPSNPEDPSGDPPSGDPPTGDGTPII